MSIPALDIPASSATTGFLAGGTVVCNQPDRKLRSILQRLFDLPPGQPSVARLVGNTSHHLNRNVHERGSHRHTKRFHILSDGIRKMAGLQRDVLGAAGRRATGKKLPLQGRFGISLVFYMQQRQFVSDEQSRFGTTDTRIPLFPAEVRGTLKVLTAARTDSETGNFVKRCRGAHRQRRTDCSGDSNQNDPGGPVFSNELARPGSCRNRTEPTQFQRATGLSNVRLQERSKM